MIEKFVDIPGYEGLYKVSNLGRVYSMPKKWISGKGGNRFHSGKVLKQSINKSGYCYVNLFKNKKIKSMRVHRLVMYSFYGESKLQVNHLDGDKANNKLDNLEYCTAKENVRHAHDVLCIKKLNGSNHGNSLLEESQVYRIKFIKKYCNVKNGYWSKLADSLNVSKYCISKIINNKHWKHVEV